MLVGIGVLGRNDVVHRIPNALEGIVYLADLDRVLCVVIGGEVPLPFDIDPFVAALSTLTWTVPFVLIEALLLAGVFAFDWVEGKRIQHDLSDHRGAGGRSAWILVIALLSFGPAAFAVILLSARRGVWWTQPAVVLAAWLMIPMAYLASSAWLSDIIALPSLRFIAGVLFTIYSIYALMKLRENVRDKYSIPEQQCQGMEDLCCSMWCSCCVIGQIARHTGEYETYKGKFCSENGLAPNTPSIV